MLLKQMWKERLKMSETDSHNANITAISTHQFNQFRIDASATLAESGSKLQELLEESMWQSTFNATHVQRRLHDLAEEVLRELAAGGTEEGSFVIE